MLTVYHALLSTSSVFSHSFFSFEDLFIILEREKAKERAQSANERVHAHLLVEGEGRGKGRGREKILSRLPVELSGGGVLNPRP